MDLAVAGPPTVAASSVLARIARHLAPPEDRLGNQLGGISLMGHQVEAASSLRAVLDAFGIALLADPVGTGKTYTALAVARGYRAVTIVAPAALRRMWERAAADAGVRAHVRTHEQLSRLTIGVAERQDLVIVDEAHHARSSSSRRYQALAALVWGSDILLLSATPLHNRERDLQNLFALGVGSSAMSFSMSRIASMMVRRDESTLALALPQRGERRWVDVTHVPAVLDAILALPPPIPPADAGQAAALGTLALVRQWCSSGAALAAALDRRITGAAAIAHGLERGQRPTRDDLALMTTSWGDVQLCLGLGPLVPTNEAASVELHRLRAHVDALRALRDTLGPADTLDQSRRVALCEIVERHSPEQMVLFSHSADTARAAFHALSTTYRCALLHGGGARIASGPVSRDWVLNRFRPERARRTPEHAATVRLLITTDVLSEGVNLQSAGIVVHLDLPWTAARLEQRLGRIRRLGSPHQQVFEYAIGPPANAERVTRIMRRLMRKAGLAQRVTGFHSPLGPAWRPTPREPAGLRATVAEQLRACTAKWLAQHIHGVTLPDATTAIAAVHSSGCHGEFVALVRTTGGSRLLASSGGEVSDDPAVILDRLRRCEEIDADVTERARRLALHRVRRWLGQAEVEHRLLHAPSAAHRETLRICARAVACGRLNRRSVAQQVERIRQLLHCVRGAGAELFLSNWCRDIGGACPSAHQLAELNRALIPRRRQEAHEAPRIVALLLLIGARADRARGLIHSRDDLSRGAL